MRKKLPRKASWHISCRIRRNNEGGKQNECKNKRLFKKIYDGYCTCNRIYPVLWTDKRKTSVCTEHVKPYASERIRTGSCMWYVTLYLNWW